jgi:hypothetical protein
MNINSVVCEVEQPMTAPKELLAACWMLIDQEMLLDVAATIAATEPEIVAIPKTTAAARPELALHWMARERETTRIA